MLIVDERVGSKDLLIALQNLGVPAELGHLYSGDVSFIGRGINDAPVYIGLELKRTTDLIGSLRSRRFQGFQLERLVNTYDRAWLISEGMWREGDGGILEVYQAGWRPALAGPRGVMASDLESWILSQTIRGGLGYRHCSHRVDTIRFIGVLYHWWVDRALDEHRGHQAIYTPSPDQASFVAPSLLRKIAAQLDGIGWEKSTAIETHFKTVVEMVEASESDWLEIPGIGKTLARRCVQSLHAA